MVYGTTCFPWILWRNIEQPSRQLWSANKFRKYQDLCKTLWPFLVLQLHFLLTCQGSKIKFVRALEIIRALPDGLANLIITYWNQTAYNGNRMVLLRKLLYVDCISQILYYFKPPRDHGSTRTCHNAGIKTKSWKRMRNVFQKPDRLQKIDSIKTQAVGALHFHATHRHTACSSYCPP